MSLATTLLFFIFLYLFVYIIMYHASRLTVTFKRSTFSNTRTCSSVRTSKQCSFLRTHDSQNRGASRRSRALRCQVFEQMSMVGIEQAYKHIYI